jgi:hypothetical protein
VPIANPPTLEEWMDDVRVVMDAVGSERAALIAHSGGGTMAMLFAATFPARVTHLVLLEGYSRLVSTADHPPGVPPQWVEALEFMIRTEWGTGRSFAATAPSLAEDPGFAEWIGRYERMSASPGTALATVRMLASVDLRSVLPSIQAPTLILHRRENPVVSVEQGRYLARHIPGARLVELPGNDHAFFAGDTRRILDEIGDFVSGASTAHPDRVLATVVFTDIVDSTRHAMRLGDAQWAALLDRHDAGTKRLVARFRGRIVKRTGDGTLATFDGPARAIQCATALRDAMRALGLEHRTGLHTGENVISEDVV